MPAGVYVTMSGELPSVLTTKGDWMFGEQCYWGGARAPFGGHPRMGWISVTGEHSPVVQWSS